MAIALLFFVFILLSVVGVPIAVSIGLATMISAAVSGDMAVSFFVRTMLNSADSFTLTAIPFFIFAGHIMSSVGISEGLFNAAKVVVGKVKGGVMIVTVVACMFFGAISGSAYAAVAGIGLIALPELRKAGLSKGAAAALIATAGSLGQMIPPSNGLIVFGALNRVSISQLFAAEIFPGILVGLCFIITCYFYGKHHNIRSERRYSFREKVKVIRQVKFSLLMPVIILGGIYSGLFTPTEAAVMAIFYGLLYGLLKRENGFSVKKLPVMMRQTVITTATVMFILGVSTGFGRILAIQKFPVIAAEFVLSHVSSKIVMLIALNALVIVLGTFLDGIAINTILSPILLGVAKQYGIDPLHYGVMFIFNATMGLLTPPLGGNLFVAAQVADASFEEIVVNIRPWLIAAFIGLLLVIFIPQLSTFLPSIMNTSGPSP